MGNCLKTQLKENVQNDSLIKMGELKIHLSIPTGLTTQYYNRISLTFLTNNHTVRVNGNHSIYAYNSSNMQAGESLGSSITIGTSEQQICFPEVGEYDLFIKGYYDLRDFGFSTDNGNIDIKILMYCSGLISFTSDLYYGRMLTGSLDNLPDSIYNISISNTLNITGTIESLINKPSLAIVNIDKSRVSGNFDLLGGTSKSINVKNSKITGSIEGYVRNKIASGIGTGSKTFAWLGSNEDIRFKGKKIVSQASNSLAWEPVDSTHTKITFNGVEETIENVVS